MTWPRWSAAATPRRRPCWRSLSIDNGVAPARAGTRGDRARPGTVGPVPGDKTRAATGGAGPREDWGNLLNVRRPERGDSSVQDRTRHLALIEHAIHHVLDLTRGKVDRQEVGIVAHPGIAAWRRLQADCRPTGVEEGRCREQCGQPRADRPAAVAPTRRITESRPTDPGAISAAMPELVAAWRKRLRHPAWWWTARLRRPRRRRRAARPSLRCLRPTRTL